MTTYLVTGAQGFLGRYLVGHLLAADPSTRVIGLGRSPRQDVSFTHHILLGGQQLPAPLPGSLVEAFADSRYSYVSADLQQLPQLIAVLKNARPQVIFHLASALRDDAVDSLFHFNVVGSVQLLEAAAAAQLAHPRIIFASTGGVYGMADDDSLPFDEEAACRPCDLYAISKLAAESALGLISRQAQTPLVIGRVFNVLGPGQNERHVCGRIMSQLTAISNGTKRNGMQIGSLETTRDFIDVRDAAAGLAILGEKGVPGEIYNVASGTETSIATMLDLSLELAGLKDIEVHRVSSRPADIPRHFGRIQRLSELGFTPQFSPRDSLEAILAYYRRCWSAAADAAR